MRDVKNDHPVAQNETFGPVAPIISFEFGDEAVKLANGATRVDTGMIHINYQEVNDQAHVPFGGVKHSSMGRYNSDTVVDGLTELKWIAFSCIPEIILSDYWNTILAQLTYH